MFFWEQADPSTGIVRDRSRTDGTPTERAGHIGSIASVGFGLSGLCIAAERGWLPAEQVVAAGADDPPVLRRADAAPARLVLSISST